MTITEGRADARPAPAGSSRVPAPLGRDPQARLEALFDPGTTALLLPADDSGILAAQGQVGGLTVVAFASDPRVQGGAMAAPAARPSSPPTIRRSRPAPRSSACGTPAAPGCARESRACTRSAWYSPP